MAYSQAAVDRYHKKTFRCVSVQFRKVQDAKLLEKLDSVPTKSEYIKQLIAEDIDEQKNRQ